jgi:hypothetical protein
MFKFRSQANFRENVSTDGLVKARKNRVYADLSFTVVRQGEGVYSKFSVSDYFMRKYIFNKEESGEVTVNRAIVYGISEEGKLIIATVADGEGISLNSTKKGDGKTAEFHSTVLESDAYTAMLLPEPISKKETKEAGVYTLAYEQGTKAQFMLKKLDTVQEGVFEMFEVEPFDKDAAVARRKEETGEEAESGEGDDNATANGADVATEATATAPTFEETAEQADGVDVADVAPVVAPVGQATFGGTGFDPNKF